MDLDPTLAPGADQVSELPLRRLLLVASGGVQAMFTPMWLQWLRAHHPQVELRYAVTRSALRFTTSTALAVAGGPARGMVDVWPDEPDSALHVELADWPDAVVVHPATMDFVARLATGRGDSPAMLALQCTQAPVVVCPGLPPGGHLNPAYQGHVRALSERDNVTVLPPVRGRSMSTGEAGVGTPALFTAALNEVAELCRWRESA